MDDTRPHLEVNPGLVEKLTILLEQAQRGEVTGFTGVVFMWHGAANLWSILPRREDREQVLTVLEDLKMLHGDLSEEATA